MKLFVQAGVTPECLEDLDDVERLNSMFQKISSHLKSFIYWLKYLVLFFHFKMCSDSLDGSIH